MNDSAVLVLSMVGLSLFLLSPMFFTWLLWFH